MKIIRFVCVFMLIVITFTFTASALEIKKVELDLKVKSAVLMDALTGTVLYSKNMNDKLPPASVTKIMTLLIVFEALESKKLTYDEEVVVSENAASMGGSQVYLEPGESMSVNELLKCVVISSANDAAVTLAERVGGSVEAFVQMMNEKAKELGMNNTYFENVTGLDDNTNNHLTSAYDIALMSKELLKYNKVTEYTTIWMDTIRNGEFGLSNTNRLIKYYKGATGLKTGYTSEAGFCLSASAKRGDMHLIAVVMGADTSNERNIAATKLLDFGFANYSIYKDAKNEYGTVKLLNGMKNEVLIGYDDFVALENLGNESKIEKEIIINDNVTAPICAGDSVGRIVYKCNGNIIGEIPLIALENVQEMKFFDYFVKSLQKFVLI